jgi:hypothetical protein
MTLPVVLNIAKHEARQADKLIRYIKKLDGTEVITFQFDDPPGMRYPEVANWAFRKICEKMKGQAFIWIEADSVPLKAGWAKALCDEYEAVGKEYLLAKQFNPPFDIFSGIGIQGPNAFDHAPENFTTGGFDEYIVRNYPDLIGRTDLIRHSYGIYDHKGDAMLHTFPRDMDIIGDKAVIFHKDQTLSLIGVLDPSFAEESIVNVSSVGDLGDIVLSLATLKHRGGVFDYYLRDNGATKGIVKRAHLIRPLLESQEYINAVRIWKREEITWASEGFRPTFHSTTSVLAGAHSRHALATGFIKTMPDFSKPWLKIEGDSKWNGSVVINRTPRYNNPHFPWRQIVSHYGQRIVFLGSGDEYEAFCNAYGRVRYCMTADMLEAAKIIAGSALYIGNQSACMTIAEGLKHPRILEAGLQCCDCVYPNATNAQYVADGTVDLPDVDGSGALSIPSQAITWRNYLVNEMPNCGKGRVGWYYQHENIMINEGYFEFAVRKVKKLTGWDDETASKAIVEFTYAMNTQWFDKKAKPPQLHVARQALRNAGYTVHSIL